MTHQSGIKASNKLNNDIMSAKETDIRCLQIRIENESLVMENEDKAVGTFIDDYDACVEKYLTNDKCSYILLRTDNKTSLGYEWLFLYWVPDDAPIKEKMLYASTRSTVKREFGESYFSDDINGHDKHDLMYSGYLKHIESKSAPPPLTMAEQELIEIKKAEKATALDDGHRTMKSASFPPTKELLEELDRFVAETIDFLEMSIDIEKETIKPEGFLQKLECDDLREKIHVEKPRYYLFRFRHDFENNSYKSIIFIYNMPGYTASVKERMLYSSCKGPFITFLQSNYQLDMQRRLEVISGDLSDLATDNLLLDLHPPPVDTIAKFTKPKGPAGRGPKRLL